MMQTFVVVKHEVISGKVKVWWVILHVRTERFDSFNRLRKKHISINFQCQDALFLQLKYKF